MSIPVYKPYLSAQSLSYAHEALDSTWLSSQGKYLSLIQDKLQELLGVKYVLPLNNGTSACHLMAKCLIRMCPTQNKKKIIVPNNVYVAAWNAFLFDQQYELIPIETDLNTWNIDLSRLDETLSLNPDADVLIVHNVGNVINVPQLQDKYVNTHFVEDNCEGFLGKYQNQYTGTSSLVSAISFFGNKNITSGEGGALVTNNEDLYLYAKCIQGQGQSDRKFIHSELGYNYRMTNIQAAILYGQLEILPTIMDLKQNVFDYYRKHLDNRTDILVQKIEPQTQHSNWMFGIKVPGNSSYEKIFSYFAHKGIEIRPMFYPIFTHTHLKQHPDIKNIECHNAEILSRECFIVPSYPKLSIIEQDYIIQTINQYIKEEV